MFEQLKKLGGKILGGIQDVLNPGKAIMDIGGSIGNALVSKPAVQQTIKNIPAAAKTVATKTYDIAASTFLPTATQEEIRSPSFLFDTLKATPGAVYDTAKKAVVHPIDSAQGLVGGIARGISNSVTDMIINNVVPSKDREGTRSVVQETLNKYLTPPDNIFSQGGEIGGSAAPFIAGGAAGRGLGGSTAVGKTIGEIIGFGSVGQATLDSGASIEERADQAIHDLVSLGVFKVGSIAYNKAKPIIRDAVIKSTDMAKSAYDSYQNLTPAEKQGGYVKNPFSESPKPLSISDIVVKKKELDKSFKSPDNIVTMPESVALRNRIRAEASTAKEVAGTMRSEFKTQAKDIAAENYGRGSVTGYFQGEKAGRVLGKKIGEFKTSNAYEAKIADIKTQFKDKAASQQLMRQSVRQFVEDNLPTSERGKFINAAANTKTPGELNKAFNRAVKAANDYKYLQGFNAEVSSRMQKIGYIRKIGEFSNTLVRDIKSQLGIKGSLRDVSLSEMDNFIKEAQTRLEFKKQNVDNRTVQPTGRELSPEELQQYREKNAEYNSRKATFTRKIQGAKEAISKASADFFTPFSSRLKSINPVLRKVFRNEFDAPLKRQIAIDNKTVEPLFKIKKKMSKNDFADLDTFLKNGSMAQAEALVGKYGFTKEFNQMRGLLTDMYNRAAQVGEVGYLEDYFPRIVKDSKGLMDYVQNSEQYVPINEAIKSREVELGRPLDKTERLQMINSLLRGFNPRNVSLSDVGNMKSRKIQELNPDLAKYYEDSFSALQRYIESMNEIIQARKFFGKNLKREGFDVPKDGEPGYKIEDTVANYVNELLAKGELSPEKAVELSNLLKERFNPARESAITSGVKDMIYANTLNSFTFGINNLQDLSTAIYRFGLGQTLKSGIKKIMPGTKLKLTSEQLGLSRMNEDIKATSFAKKSVNAILRVASLGTDSFTRDVYIDAMISKYEKMAMQKNHPELMKRLENSLLDKDVQEALKGLQNKEVNQAIEKLAYNEIADFQPVSLSEMPIDYIKGNKARLVYTLKSFLVKQLDYMRQEHIADIKKNPTSPTGYINLAKFVFALMTTGAATNVVNNILMGQKTDFNELMLNNFLRIFGVSRYVFYNAQRNGLKDAVANQVIPGFGILDDISKDVINPPKSLINAESIKSIPLFGRPAYWWLGKGAEKTAKKDSGGGSSNGLGLSPSDLGLSPKDLGVDPSSLGLSPKDLGL